MDWKYLFTSFEGRIGRLRWWAGLIGLSLAGGLFFAVMSPDRSSASQILALLTGSAVFIYAWIALMKKRLNDRERPIWYLYVFLAPGFISNVLFVTGLGYNMTDMGGAQVPILTTLSWIISGAAYVVGIWSLVELGILKGTTGQNLYGPDPLASDTGKKIQENTIQARLRLKDS